MRESGHTQVTEYARGYTVQRDTGAVDTHTIGDLGEWARRGDEEVKWYMWNERAW
jgi:hypothetical protein